MRREDYAALGGHMAAVIPIDEVVAKEGIEVRTQLPGNPWPTDPTAFPWNT